MASQLSAVIQEKQQNLKDKLLQYKVCKTLGLLKYNQRLYWSEITIQLNNNSELLFIKDGEILQSQNLIGSGFLLNINTNTEHLKRLFWIGCTNQNGQKIGKWSAIWGGEKLNVGGCYNNNGEKSGWWIELFENYWDKAQVKYEGEYIQGKRNGYWKIFYKDSMIGGGEFNLEGEKTGIWIEPFENFSSWCKIIERGMYKNGQKTGEWIQIFKNKIIGFGTYNDNQVKVGKWVDLHESFHYQAQVTYQGRYLNGIKTGNWKAMLGDKKIGGGHFKEGQIRDGEWVEIDFRNIEITYIGQYQNGKARKQLYISYQKDIIGGGTFNENGMKNGKWVELHDNYFSYGKVTFEGIYKNDKKQGIWKVIYNKNIIGEMQYSFGQKSGIQIDLHEHFSDSCQVKYKGEYKNGKKFKKWDTFYQFDIIGGGNYDDNELKNGEWITLDENFGMLCKVTYKGIYKSGRKIGKWNTYYKNEIIGGGFYDQNGIQQGKWDVLHSNFWDQLIIKLKGVFLDGIKIGYWEMNQQNKKIGGGFYDRNGEKQGKWIELSEKFLASNLLVQGQYIDSKKCGKWDAYLNQKLIGCGFYNDNGHKQGNWIELNDPYLNSFLTYFGNYDNGKKQGNWDMFYNNKILGGGYYGECGLKNGKWIDIVGELQFKKDEQITQEYEYKNGVQQ